MQADKLFKKFQPELLAFANTGYGRKYFSNFGDSELKEDYRTVKVTPDSVHQLLEFKGTKSIYRAVIYSGSPYIKLLGEVLTMCDIAFENNKRVTDKKLSSLVIPHFLGETLKLSNRLPKIFLTTTTFNPDASSVDGDVYREIADPGEVWGTIKAGAGTGTDATSATFYAFKSRASGTTSPNFIRFRRGIVGFLTSSLGTGVNISSATFSTYGSSVLQEDATVAPSLNVYGATLSSNTALANTDFANVASTSFSTTIPYASIVTSAYNDWVLNANGIANINITGNSNFSIRDSVYDVGGSTPGYLSTAEENIVMQSSEGANKPKLVVIYTNAGASFKSLTGVGI